jgi:HAD superfamily hydrolase (TIGR01509 family)
LNNIKAILFDIDGVLLLYTDFFTEQIRNVSLEKEFELLMDCYRSEQGRAAATGNGDLLNQYTEVLKAAGIRTEPEKILKEIFEIEMNCLDNEVIQKIRELSAAGIHCFLATDQNQYRAEFLLAQRAFQKPFIHAFISYALGSTKKYPKFWEQAIPDLQQRIPGLKAEEILYFDDIEHNVDSANGFGIQAQWVEANISIVPRLETLLTQLVSHE